MFENVSVLRAGAESVAALSHEGPVAVDPDIAEAMGAFSETALDAMAALDSHFDGEEVFDREVGHE